MLLHGLSGSSKTWWELGPELAARGYHVLAPDLRGHGKSPRGRYSREIWADDVLETVPEEPELVLGHSVGGVVLSMLTERLRPQRAVYDDPAWWVIEGGFGVAMEKVIRPQKDYTAADLERLYPHWSAQARAVRLKELADWDIRTTYMDYLETGYVPFIEAVPSLVVLADPSVLTTPPRQAELKALGFEVRIVAGTSHNVHVDDFPNFMKALDGWI